MTLGIDGGSIRILSAKLLRLNLGTCSGATGRRGGGGAAQEIGGCRTRPSGRPTVLSEGIVSNIPITRTCSPNEVNVVQLLCVRWAHDVCSMLSANMVSSSVKLFAGMDTTRPAQGTAPKEKIGRVFTRPAGTFGTPKVSVWIYLDGSLDLGVVGFGAAPEPDGALGVAGFAAPAGGGGAATPDCTL